MLIRYFSRSDGGVRRYRRGELKDYMELLVRNFNPDTTETLMCSNTLSVGWDGRIFDCDFNQQLELGKILRYTPFLPTNSSVWYVVGAISRQLISTSFHFFPLPFTPVPSLFPSLSTLQPNT